VRRAVIGCADHVRDGSPVPLPSPEIRRRGCCKGVVPCPHGFRPPPDEAVRPEILQPRAGCGRKYRAGRSVQALSGRPALPRSRRTCLRVRSRRTDGSWRRPASPMHQRDDCAVPGGGGTRGARRGGGATGARRPLISRRTPLAGWAPAPDRSPPHADAGRAAAAFGAGFDLGFVLGMVSR
jgi:hypothetical protein